jgi:hypothetical protein
MGLALLLGGCASGSDAPTTVRTRGDNDPDALLLANQRFSGGRGFCLWAEYYRVYKTAETCGVPLTAEEEQNFHLVMAAIEHSIIANARGNEVASLRLRQSRAQFDQYYLTVSDDDRTTICEPHDVNARLIQNYLSKRVSDSLLIQSQIKGDPFVLFCTP